MNCPPLIRRLIGGCLALFGRKRVERKLDEELRQYLETAVEHKMAVGLSRQEALRQARLEMGSREAVKDEVRHAGWETGLETVGQDVRFALRMLRRSPGFTFVAVLTLALGIGANTAIFSLVNGVLLQPLPYANDDRIVHLRQPAQLIDVENAGFSPLEIADYREQSRTLESLVEYHAMSFVLIGRDEPRRVQTGVVSWNYFDFLGVSPLLGRNFRAEDETHEADAVVLLSFDFWQRAFGGDPGIVGETFEMNDRVHTVVGVLPPIPEYPAPNDVYMPVTSCPFRNAAAWAENRTARGLTALGRVQAGVPEEALQSDLAAIAGGLSAEYPNAYPADRGYETIAVPLREALTAAVGPTLWALLATSLSLLLIVCTNLVNLTLARHVARQKEMVIRTALGAQPGRLMRQLVTEASLLTLTGGAAGLLVAFASLDLLRVFVARFSTRAAEVAIDPTVLLFTLAVSVATGLALGVLPAFRSRHNLAAETRAGSPVMASGHPTVRRALVVSQVAVSFMLLIGAGLMIRSFVNLTRVDPGFDPANVLTARIDLNWSRYDSAEGMLQFSEALHARLSTLPGVASVGFSGSHPLNAATPLTVAVDLEGQVADDARPTPSTWLTSASPEYFAALGLRQLTGRTFDAFDRASGRRVVVVTQSFAERHWPGENALGRRVRPRSGAAPEWHEIVGVVDDVKQHRLDQEQTDLVYVPFTGLQDMRLLVRSNLEPAALERQIRDAVRRIDPNQPVTEVRTLAQVQGESLASPQLTTTLMGLFAGLALAITTAGVGGLVAFSVSRKASEIGVRLALGASRASVLSMILREGMTLVAIGLVLGVLGALALGRMLADLLFGVPPTDPWTFAAVSLILGAVAATACLAPALRASRISPTVLLRRGS